MLFDSELRGDERPCGITATVGGEGEGVVGKGGEGLVHPIELAMHRRDPECGSGGLPVPEAVSFKGLKRARGRGAQQQQCGDGRQKIWVFHRSTGHGRRTRFPGDAHSIRRGHGIANPKSNTGLMLGFNRPESGVRSADGIIFRKRSWGSRAWRVGRSEGAAEPLPNSIAAGRCGGANCGGTVADCKATRKLLSLDLL